MQTQVEHLSEADKADPIVVRYVATMIEVQRLTKALGEAQAKADVLAAAIDTQTGETRGRLGRLAAHLGLKEQSIRNQRQRGKLRSGAA